MQINNGFIAIKEPCHQGWENMSVSEKGKFCSSCKKHVHDFSNSTISEIKEAYAESEGGLCGHVPVKLLQEQYFEENLQKGHISNLKRFWIAAIFCFGASLFTVDSAKASTFYKVKTAFFNFVADTKDTIVVKGVVKDKNSQKRISYAIVAVVFNNAVICKATANINGEYEVKIPKEYSTVNFMSTSVGYETRLIKNVSVSILMNTVVDIDLQIHKELMLEGDIDVNYIEPK